MSTRKRILQETIADSLVVERDAATGYVVFNDPQRHNAMSFDMWRGLSQAMDAFRSDDSIRSVVLSGAGDRAFVSGANISQFDQLRSSEADVQAYEQVSEGAQMAVYQFPKPTIAKIRGFCLGGGMGLALCCDIRIAADDGVFGIPAGRLGLGYRLSAMNCLVKAVGSATALDIFLSARRFKGREALDAKLVQHMVPSTQLDTFVQEYIDQVNANAPLTLRVGKEMIRAFDAIPDGIDRVVMTEGVKACYQSNDYREGKMAFKEKRLPRFTGA